MRKINPYQKYHIHKVLLKYQSQKYQKKTPLKDNLGNIFKHLTDSINDSGNNLNDIVDNKDGYSINKMDSSTESMNY